MPYLEEINGIIGVADYPDRVWAQLRGGYLLKHNTRKAMRSALPLSVAKDLVKIGPGKRLKAWNEYGIPEVVDRAMREYEAIFEFSNWYLPGRLLATLAAEDMAFPLLDFLNARNLAQYSRLYRRLDRDGIASLDLIEQQRAQQDVQLAIQATGNKPQEIWQFYHEFTLRQARIAALIMLPEITVACEEIRTTRDTTKGPGPWHEARELRWFDAYTRYLANQDQANRNLDAHVVGPSGDKMPGEGLPRDPFPVEFGDTYGGGIEVIDIDDKARRLEIVRGKDIFPFESRNVYHVTDSGVGASPLIAARHPFHPRTIRHPLNPDNGRRRPDKNEISAAVHLTATGFQGEVAEGAHVKRVGWGKTAASTAYADPVIYQHFREDAGMLGWYLECGVEVLAETSTSAVDATENRNWILKRLGPPKEVFKVHGHLRMRSHGTWFPDEKMCIQTFDENGRPETEKYQLQLRTAVPVVFSSTSGKWVTGERLKEVAPVGDLTKSHNRYGLDV